MRNSDPIFWPGSEADLSKRQEMNKNYSDCINILQTQWYQADLDQQHAEQNYSEIEKLVEKLQKENRRAINKSQ